MSDTSEIPNVLFVPPEIDEPLAPVPFKPLYDRVVIKRRSAETRTAGGLYIPDTATSKEKPDQGVVAAVGPGNVDLTNGKAMPMSVEVGQKVLFSKYAGTEVEIDGVQYVIVRDFDIMAILD